MHKHLLPAGPLRESVSGLRDADLVWATDGWVRGLDRWVQIRSRRVIRHVYGPHGSELGVEWLKGRSVIPVRHRSTGFVH